MIVNGNITIWHKKLDKVTGYETYTAYQFPVSMQSDLKVLTSNNGLAKADLCKIRIPTSETLNISVGDKIVYSLSAETKPPKTAHTILQVADNRKMSTNMWHYKVVCE